MEVEKALLNRRTIRKFTQEKLKQSDLIDLIEYARVCAYPANLQPLKFSVITADDMLAKIFPNIKWAGYLSDGAPKENERPTAYIAIFGDKEIKNSFETEAGAAITAMMTGAFDKGIASCWLGAINRNELMTLFGLGDERYNLLYLLALGYPLQQSKICKMENDVKYYEDENGVINVPKRSLDEIIIKL